MLGMDGPGQAGDGKPDFVARERVQRLAKQERLQAKEGPAYGYDHTLAQARAGFDGLAAGGESDERLSVAGRLFSRSDGVLDGIADLDRGDWIGVTGTGMRTQKGELSIRVREWRLLTKSLRALPDKHRGLTDVDTRLRERYLDLIVNPYFQIKSLRDFNAKFDPRWAPRSIMVEDVGSMSRVGLLYASVEGFLNLPLVGRRLDPRQEPAAPPVAQPAGAVTAA
jgi:hypothetical protein